MNINPILYKSQWDIEGKYELQVIPHHRNPGVFIARVIVGDQETHQSDVDRLWKEMSSCENICEVHVFITNDNTTSPPVSTKPTSVKPHVRDAFSRAFTYAAAQNGIEYFLIKPGIRPKEPIYPVWVRDFKRSMQVIEGKYREIIPPMFEFVPTLNCIFRCHQCSYRLPKERLGIWTGNIFSPEFHMCESKMILLLGKLKDADVQEVLFTGGGEPLLNKITPKAMKYAHDDLGFKVGLYTNGALLTEATAREIVNAKPAYVRVSLNAGQQEVYLKHHSPLNKSTERNYASMTKAGIELLAQIKYELESKMTLGISYLVDPENAVDVVNGSRLIAKLGKTYPGMINYMRFTPSVNYFGNEQHPREYFEKALSEIERESVPMLKEAGVECNIYQHRFRGLYEPRTYSQCLASGWYGGVGPDGVVYMCCEKLFDPRFSFGSLVQKSLMELWSGNKRRKVLEFADRAVKGEIDIPCPIVCKPHEHNKVFAKIEKLRHEGQIEVVRCWLTQIHRLVKESQKDADVRLYGFQS